ncbi:AraC family transcriptional regulator [Paenibacillus alginolyticus]|uniref:AraC family transcriptional regulator n=1 Tax=Paenibacillus alginolyticus TaxID=59839 RepID=A0ABT4GMD8_9BACL|nr:AraC family transcriptional regulator [Paenibacillus alginolyticus]MCY9697378.1 AraC family transcriptional regulator [Paenibacillus alginolyticus]MEC0146226.1 AraC family transcriptional regulator [Paenibacillus alginolyticus]
MTILIKLGKYGPVYHLPPLGEPPPLSVQFLGINYCETDYCNIRKLAKITVFGFVLSGQGYVRAGTQSYMARQGDVFILPAGCCHEVTSDPDHKEQWSYIWLNISGNWILKMLEAYQLLPRVVTQDSGLESLFKEAIESAKEKSVEEMQSEFQVILMRIIVSLSETLRKRGDALTSTVQAIKQFVDNSILHPFDSTQLASHIGISNKQMNRLFKREVGTTIYNYVISKKIESAKRMLLDTQLTISDIGYKLGYVDSHYFSNLFHSKTGVRPSDFRKIFCKTR